jgi:hypothetical protein
MNGGMKRALEAFQGAILMVDTTKEGWSILHVNSGFLSQTGPAWLAALCPCSTSI